MSDYGETGAQPVEDAAVADPPTVEEVAEEQRRRFPDQADSVVHGEPSTTSGDPDDD